ncbi:cation diffusion facilitator family [Fimicolochytrium jonesii]|uniref:cation diffusion facilitator family n=1 Tax=Fimicolochytrium jonesii TaxID=1396493 RepID=UPI0022FE7359|nr:cation diffusion facilitator family [Fimicolochytrium jonesii]KAI8826197.1 cation diffusion facilitator family [Fimicolochytrium jonesii]
MTLQTHLLLSRTACRARPRSCRSLSSLPSLSISTHPRLRPTILRTPLDSSPLGIHRRQHGTHSHHHGVRMETREGTRVTIAGIGVNVGLTIAKGVGGVAWQSASLIAEAVHSLSDLLSDFVTLFTYGKARAPPSQRFPYGFGKLEPVGGLVVSALLVAAGAGIAVHSYEVLLPFIISPTSTPTPTPPHHLPTAALQIMLLSVLSKEAMFRWTRSVATRTHSSVLLANAWHHRVDALSSLVALGGVAGGVMGVGWADAVGGVVVSGMIVKAGVQAGWPSLLELLDAAAPPELYTQINTALESFRAHQGHITAVRNLRVRKTGPFSYADMQIILTPSTSVSEASQIANDLRENLMHAVDGLQEVLIEIRCDDGSGPGTSTMTTAHAKEYDGDGHGH